MSAREAGRRPEEPAAPAEGPSPEEARRLKKELKLLAVAFGCALLIVSCLGVSSAVLGAYLDARGPLEAPAPAPEGGAEDEPR